jgi:outer membrane protein assembly factor BamB
VLTARELTVVGLEGRVEWSFALPGRADNGERFVAVAGFDGANVLLASTDPKEGGRVYALNAETGKQVAFRKFEGGFRANALFAVNGPTRELYAASGDTVMAFNLDKDGAPAVAQLSFPTAHLTAGNDAAYVGVPNGLLAVKPPGDRATAAWFLQGGGIVPTAPGAFAMTSRGVHFYAPLRAAQGSTGHLSSFEASKRRESAMHWSIDVPKAITAPPVARGDSVYFAAGSVLYRASAATGAVHWKNTLALEANDALTGMAFDGDDLVTWGGGVVARVTDRGEPVTPIAPAPRERVRQVFHFGPGVFDSQ